MTYLPLRGDLLISKYFVLKGKEIQLIGFRKSMKTLSKGRKVDTIRVRKEKPQDFKFLSIPWSTISWLWNVKKKHFMLTTKLAVQYSRWITEFECKQCCCIFGNSYYCHVLKVTIPIIWISNHPIFVGSIVERDCLYATMNNIGD